ncbi:hypothetical protein VNO77_29832 [Canavalia gladiata]|uniref:F-box domain-containing protein n=1 Tax=Canavalia gladiata TaxID=3824 RepID=A0AAN9KMJ4_CANGL
MTESFDFISLLPNSLLSTIISFLPFKEAVRTSVLSKNWLNICKSTTNIEFNELFFVKPNEPPEIRKAQRRTFLEFTRSWIVNHTGTLVDKFCLTLSMPQNVGDVIERCIAFATQHGVKELELDFSDPNWHQNKVHYYNHGAQFKLPEHVYWYTRLESLKLYSCSFVETEMVNFHALKQVYLGWMEVSVVAIKALLTNCKMLESLSMQRCWNFDSFDLGQEQNTRLRKLVLDKCLFLFVYFKVNAPNLKIFKYCGLMKFFIIEIDSLEMEEADMDLKVMVIPSGRESLRMQQDMNVRHLIIKTALHENEFLGITFLLNSCPMLEYLTIELCTEKNMSDYKPLFDFNRARFWIDNVGAYKCLSSSLRVPQQGETGVDTNYRKTESQYLRFSHSKDV